MTEESAIGHTRENIFSRMHPIYRKLISLGLTLLTFFLVHRKGMGGLMQGTLLWDVFAFSFLLLEWIVLTTRPTIRMRELARKEDNSRIVIFALIIGASFASMFLVLLLILSKDVSNISPFTLPLAVLGVLLAWALVHTVFTFHYAFMYYDDDEQIKTRNAGGLDFPGGHIPDYLDFAYFSFVIGMTFQVSDVVITSRKMRRQVLVHGLLAFAFNTFVVALAINVIAGLKG